MVNLKAIGMSEFMRFFRNCFHHKALHLYSPVASFHIYASHSLRSLALHLFHTKCLFSCSVGLMLRKRTMCAFRSSAFKSMLFLILFVSAVVHATAENNDIVDSPAELAHPEQVHLSLGEKPDQMVVTWITMTKRKSRPNV